MLWSNILNILTRDQREIFGKDSSIEWLNKSLIYNKNQVITNLDFSEH